MNLAVVFDFLTALQLHHASIFQLELVGGVVQILFLDQHTLKSFRVEAEGGTALQALLVGILINPLELLERILGGHIRCLGNGRIHPLLRSGLDILCGMASGLIMAR